MTLDFKPLEAYFDRIIPQPPIKEKTMFKYTTERIKSYWDSVMDSLNTMYSWKVSVNDPVTKDSEQDYYHFEMYTAPWYDPEEEATVPAKHTMVFGDHVENEEDVFWTSIVDKILDQMSKHYGYDIKSQVYYAVEFPFNDIADESGRNGTKGRMLNAEVLDQLLLAFPEVFDRHPVWNKPKNVFGATE